MSLKRKFTFAISSPDEFLVQLSHSIHQIIAFDKGVPLVNAFVIGNRFEYCHESYIVEN